MAGAGAVDEAPPAAKLGEPEPHPVMETLVGVEFCVNSSPPWLETMVLGFQHYFLTVGMISLTAAVLVPSMGGSDKEKAIVIQTMLLVSGLNTLLQSLFGTRLLTVIGSSYTYVIPATSVVIANTYVGGELEQPHERFERTMRGIQGALISASILQMVLCFLGLWRNLVRLLTPLSMVPLVTFCGLGLFHLGFPNLANCVEVGLPQLVLMVIFSQYIPHMLKPSKLFYCRYSLLFTTVIVWTYAQILTTAGVYSHKPVKTQLSCRPDRSGLIKEAPWILFPRPFQWGMPTFCLGESVTMMVASFVAMFESTGTFLAVSRYGSATPVPPSVLSRGAGWLVLFGSLQGAGARRGIGMRTEELTLSHCFNYIPIPRPTSGIGTLLTGLFGCVTGPSASVENAGLLALSRVGSRRVVQISAAFMIFFSLFGKLGAIFASVPLPIMAASYCVMCGYVCSAGLGFLQFCNLNSFRTKFILGFSCFLGISLPHYYIEYQLRTGSNPIHTPARWFNDAMTVIFVSSPMVAGMLSLLLDNTVETAPPETRKDNGAHWWERFILFGKDVRNAEFYSLPCKLDRFFPPL